MQTEPTESPPPTVVDRPGERRGFLGTGWPVVALALMLLLLLRACVPAAPAAPAAPVAPFKSAAAAAR